MDVNVIHGGEIRDLTRRHNDDVQVSMAKKGDEVKSHKDCARKQSTRLRKFHFPPLIIN